MASTLPDNNNLSIISAILAIYFFILSKIEDDCDDTKPYEKNMCGCCIALIVLFMYIIPMYLL